MRFHNLSDQTQGSWSQATDLLTDSLQFLVETLPLPLAGLLLHLRVSCSQTPDSWWRPSLSPWLASFSPQGKLLTASRILLKILLLPLAGLLLHLRVSVLTASRFLVEILPLPLAGLLLHLRVSVLTASRFLVEILPLLLAGLLFHLRVSC
jgi:hypothetical protein